MKELVEWKVFIDSVDITFKVFFLFLAFCCFVAFGAKPGNCASLKKYVQLRFEKKNIQLLVQDAHLQMVLFQCTKITQPKKIRL